jgi:hypothetical protein
MNKYIKSGFEATNYQLFLCRYSSMVKLNFILICFITIFFANINSLLSITKDKEHMYFGIGYLYSFESDITNFKGVTDVQSCCINDLSGGGSNNNLNFTFIFKRDDFLNFGINLGYKTSKSIVYTFEKELINVSGNLYNGEFKHSLEVEYKSIDFGLFYPLYPNEKSLIAIGAAMNYIIDDKYHQKEEISFPVDKGVFQDSQTRTRNDYSGKLENINNIQYQFYCSIEYMMPLNRIETFYLVPRINFSYRLTELIKGSGWKAFSYGIGLSLTYRYGKK